VLRRISALKRGNVTGWWEKWRVWTGFALLRWWTLVNVVMNLRVCTKGEIS
jgi:hypothetical protein